MTKRISLTFDNGPTPGVTEHVLDVLRGHDVKATFFVLGEKIADPAAHALAAMAHDEGHRIGNHTFTHKVLFGTEPDQAKVLDEITRTQDALGDLGAERLFRPYGGGGHLDHRLLSRTAYDYLQQHGYTMVLWNSIPRDWIEPDQWPETAMDQITDLDWTVMVIHDLPTGAMDHLDRFIATAKAVGYAFTQDFPTELTPLRRGQPVCDISAFISAL